MSSTASGIRLLLQDPEWALIIFHLLLQYVHRPIYHKQHDQIKYIVTVLKANQFIK